MSESYGGGSCTGSNIRDLVTHPRPSYVRMQRINPPSPFQCLPPAVIDRKKRARPEEEHCKLKGFNNMLVGYKRMKIMNGDENT